MGTITDPKEVSYKGNRKAWLIEYNRPLSKEEIASFELRILPDKKEVGNRYKKKWGNQGNFISFVVDSIESDHIKITESVHDKFKEFQISFNEFARRKEEWIKELR